MEATLAKREENVVAFLGQVCESPWWVRYLGSQAFEGCGTAAGHLRDVPQLDTQAKET